MVDSRPDDGRLSPEQALRELAGIVLTDSSYDAVLTRATHVAKRAIPGADDVSVTMQRDGAPTTVASSGKLAEEVDETQYDVGRGPCLDAVRTGESVLVSDLADDSRWPSYGPRAVGLGIASSLSVPLLVDAQPVGAFNIYSLRTGSFDSDSVRRLATDLAGYAAVVLNNASLYFTAASRADQMAEAMKSRAVIEQAKGILMAQRRCSPDEAFEVLVRLSQETHRKLREIAETLVAQISATT